jgi:hypothetical protein
MRAPSHRGSTTKRIDDEAAIEEASRRLRPLLADVISWNESSVPPKKKFKAAIGLVDGVLDNAEGALNKAEYALHEAMKCRLNERAKHLVADIELARKAAIPELRQARPAKGRRHGQYKDLNASRNQRIAETVASMGKQFEMSQEQASWVVSETLKRLIAERERVFEWLIKTKKADPAWIKECRKFVAKLRLAEDTVEDIAKQYRTLRE